MLLLLYFELREGVLLFAEFLLSPQLIVFLNNIVVNILLLPPDGQLLFEAQDLIL